MTLVNLWSVDNLKIALCALLIFTETAAIMLPVLRYVCVGWSIKEQDIMDSLDANAKLAYFKMFGRDYDTKTPSEASTAFDAIYYRWYGRKLYVVPGLLLLLTALVGSTLATLSALKVQGCFSAACFTIPYPAIAALAGAYLWVVNDFISRARRLDFSPSDVMWGVLRLVVAVPMGYAFAAIASASMAPFVAFALGAFPLTALTSMLRQLANKQLGLQPTADEAKDDIIKLQGINKAIVERLGNEDVTTVTQVAYCDPIRLVMRSNLTFNFVTDCMNQALAWMYLEGAMDKIRPFGMRGACEIKNLIDDFDSVGGTVETAADHNRAVAAFPLIATAAGLNEDALQITFRQIAEDPYTLYLSEVWG